MWHSLRFALRPHSLKRSPQRTGRPRAGHRPGFCKDHSLTLVEIRPSTKMDVSPSSPGLRAQRALREYRPDQVAELHEPALLGSTGARPIAPEGLEIRAAEGRLP